MGFLGLMAQAGLDGAAEGVGAWGRGVVDESTKSNLLAQQGQQQMSLADHENLNAFNRANALEQAQRDYDDTERQKRAAVVSQAHDDWTSANPGLTPTPYQSAMISADGLARAGYAKEGLELARAGLYIGTGDWRGRQGIAAITPNRGS